MKKHTIVIVAIFLMLSLSSCSASISKYKKNTDDGYINQNYISGGDEAVNQVSIDSIEFADWLGGENLTFKFDKENEKAHGIPKYEVFFINNKTELQIKLYGCNGISGDISKAFNSKFLKNITSKQKDDAYIINLTFADGLKYMIEEFDEPSLLVINIKQLS